MEPIHGLSPFLFLANQTQSTVDKYLQNFYIVFQYFCITWAEISWWSSIQDNSEKAILKKRKHFSKQQNQALVTFRFKKWRHGPVKLVEDSSQCDLWGAPQWYHRVHLVPAVVTSDEASSYQEIDKSKIKGDSLPKTAQHLTSVVNRLNIQVYQEC